MCLFCNNHLSVYQLPFRFMFLNCLRYIFWTSLTLAFGVQMKQKKPDVSMTANNFWYVPFFHLLTSSMSSMGIAYRMLSTMTTMAPPCMYDWFGFFVFFFVKYKPKPAGKSSICCLISVFWSSSLTLTISSRGKTLITSNSIESSFSRLSRSLTTFFSMSWSKVSPFFKSWILPYILSQRDL